MELMTFRFYRDGAYCLQDDVSFYVRVKVQLYVPFYLEVKINYFVRLQGDIVGILRDLHRLPF